MTLVKTQSTVNTKLGLSRRQRALQAILAEFRTLQAIGQNI